ncbi:hypothetical protein SUGI_0244240 [Cryptomeria japonica]|nr:hypothetical protein SUGI_0244240 [Cryptomeria japonica]
MALLRLQLAFLLLRFEICIRESKHKKILVPEVASLECENIIAKLHSTGIQRSHDNRASCRFRAFSIIRCIFLRTVPYMTRSSYLDPSKKSQGALIRSPQEHKLDSI